MEHSSPLAAMQPPSLLPHFGLASESQLHVPSPNVFNPNFNFSDIGMRKPSPDYFAMKLVRGSSPTVSLAADLSQNFHIDKRWVTYLGERLSCILTLASPRLPTPRRSLFTSNLFGTLSGRGM
jgi:M-phase inducer tyrosine phosphatase